MNIFLLSILLLVSSAYAKIVEVSHFSQIQSHITSDTLILLDIDDTLLVPAQMLGCDEWFLHRLNTHKATGMQSPQALEKSLAEWEAVRHITKMEIVEKGTDLIVRDLQDRNFCIMGMTTQGLALATRTVQQLAENNIDLSITAPAAAAHYLDVNHHGALYRKGILFTAGGGKGKALLAFCKEIAFSPKRILFINDKETHIADVEAEADAQGIEFIGLRYAYSDARKALFDPQIADLQFTHSSFAQILSDTEASNLLNKQ